MMAAPAWDLPDEVRTRTYTASIAPSASPNIPAGTSFTATIGGSAFAGGLDNLTVGVSGNRGNGERTSVEHLRGIRWVD
jgi:hypothetical protein